MRHFLTCDLAIDPSSQRCVVQLMECTVYVNVCHWEVGCEGCVGVCVLRAEVCEGEREKLQSAQLVFKGVQD